MKKENRIKIYAMAHDLQNHKASLAYLLYALYCSLFMCEVLFSVWEMMGPMQIWSDLKVRQDNDTFTYLMLII